MLRHRIYIVLFALMAVLNLSAQQDRNAKEILDKVAQMYSQSQGMRVDFKGTQLGTLWIKGEKFVLDCGGVKSWFDGETQWSYVADNQEANVSTPTPEELQSINPYMLVTMYRNGFNYRMNGQRIRNGKRCNEINLIPINSQDIRMFLLSISEDNLPLYIGVDMVNGHYEEFIVTSFKKESLSDDFFRFDDNLYPDAEIIDLR